MNQYLRLPPAGSTAVAHERPGRMHRLRTWIVDWCTAWSDYYAAAEMYRQLSRLSNAELERRGLSRATLARDVVAAREQRRRRR